MKKYLILACILLQYAIMLDNVWASESYPYVVWGGNIHYFGTAYDNVSVGSNSDRWDRLLDGTVTSQTYSFIYYRGNYSEWSGSITGGISVKNNTSNTYTVFYDLCSVYPNTIVPTFINTGGNDISSYFFNTSGWSDYLQSSNMHISTFPRNEAIDYINTTADFFSDNLSVTALLNEADLVGSILVNKFGVQDEYSVNEFGAALNDFCAGLFGVESYNSTGRLTIIAPSQYIYADRDYDFLVTGANEKHILATFGIQETSTLQNASASDLMNLYNSNTGSGWTLYTEDQLNTIFEILPYDPDVSLGDGSTNNFRELLIYLFKPSYTGIESNYSDLVDGLGILYMPIDYINCILGTVSGTYNANMVLAWDDIDMLGITIDGSNFSFSPSNILPDDLADMWVIFQYFSMFVVVMGLVIHTWRHLFSGNGDEGGSAI